MRAKKAKALRKTAQALTEGAANVSYHSYTPPLYRQMSPYGPFTKIAHGKPLRMENICTRKVYKDLKRAA